MSIVYSVLFLISSANYMFPIPYLDSPSALAERQKAEHLRARIQDYELISMLMLSVHMYCVWWLYFNGSLLICGHVEWRMFAAPLRHGCYTHTHTSWEAVFAVLNNVSDSKRNGVDKHTHHCRLAVAIRTSCTAYILCTLLQPWTWSCQRNFASQLA